jgi:hypothetical protein
VVVSPSNPSGRRRLNQQGPVRSAGPHRSAVGSSASAPSPSAVAPSSRKAAAPSGSARAVGGRRGWRDVDARLLAVVGRLTERDRTICRLLDDHRVLTTPQVADVGFTGERRARMRLAELYALDVLDRFRPQTWGSPTPFHWVLGPLGAALVAAETGADLSDLSWRRTLAHDLAASQRLAHLVGLNGFFCGLLRSARTRPGCALCEWWSERRCAREWGEVVRPDGYGIWTEHGTALPFLVEYDNGSEPLDRLAAKLPGYARLAAAAGHPNWVLFSFGSPRRERDARRALLHRDVPVATAWRQPGTAPDAAIWLPVDADTHQYGLGQDGRGRLGLAQLAHLPLGRA